MTMKAHLTFNSAELTDHNNNFYISEIYARNCTGKNKIIPFGQTVLKKWTWRGFAKCLQRVGSRNPRYLRKYFKYCKKALDLPIQYILQHDAAKISAKSEMVE